MTRLFILILLTTITSLCSANQSLYQNLGLSPVASAPVQQGPLPAPQAFNPSMKALKGLVKVQFRVAPGYHLYKSRLKFGLSKNSDAQIGEFKLPKGQFIQDQFFGKQEVYNGQVNFSIPIDGTVKAGEFLKLHYQGCSKTICYPPQDLSINLLPQVAPVSQQSNISTQLSSHKNIWLILGSLLVLGILLAFTPCVLPMVPILSGIIVGQDNKSFWRGFSLSLSYVLGMAITYAILGIVITRIGASFQATLQSPWILIGTAVLFVILAISMLGLFSIQLPQFIRHQTMTINNKLKGGSLIGVFIMGVVSTLVISPCTSAPLIGVLSYVIQTGDVIYGGLALFVLGLGMGIPLLIIGSGFSHVIPTAGPWMQKIRTFIGFLMLGVAVYLLSRLISLSYVMGLTGILLIVYAVFMGTYRSCKTNWQRIGRGIGVVLTLYGISLFIGGLMGNRDFLMPLKTSNSVQTKSLLNFTRVKNLAALNRLLNQAKLKQQPVMVDYFADWCVECHKLESFVFTKKAVAKSLRAYRLIQVDVTKDTPESKTLMDQYQIIGLPTLLFFNDAGKEINGARLVGDISATQLTNHVDKLSALIHQVH